SSMLNGGIKSFNTILNTEGIQTVTATDMGNSTITGTTGPIVLSTATHFDLSLPLSATVRQPFSFRITALTGNSTVDTGYLGTIHFSSSDLGAILPPDSPLPGG